VQPVGRAGAQLEPRVRHQGHGGERASLGPELGGPDGLTRDRREPVLEGGHGRPVPAVLQEKAQEIQLERLRSGLDPETVRHHGPTAGPVDARALQDATALDARLQDRAASVQVVPAVVEQLLRQRAAHGLDGGPLLEDAPVAPPVPAKSTQGLSLDPRESLPSLAEVLRLGEIEEAAGPGRRGAQRVEVVGDRGVLVESHGQRGPVSVPELAGEGGAEVPLLRALVLRQVVEHPPLGERGEVVPRDLGVLARVALAPELLAEVVDDVVALLGGEPVVARHVPVAVGHGEEQAVGVRAVLQGRRREGARLWVRCPAAVGTVTGDAEPAVDLLAAVEGRVVPAADQLRVVDLVERHRPCGPQAEVAGPVAERDARGDGLPALEARPPVLGLGGPRPLGVRERTLAPADLEGVVLVQGPGQERRLVDRALEVAAEVGVGRPDLEHEVVAVVSTEVVGLRLQLPVHEHARGVVLDHEHHAVLLPVVESALAGEGADPADVVDQPATPQEQRLRIGHPVPLGRTLRDERPAALAPEACVDAAGGAPVELLRLLAGLRARAQAQLRTGRERDASHRHLLVALQGPVAPDAQVTGVPRVVVPGEVQDVPAARRSRGLGGERDARAARELDGCVTNRPGRPPLHVQVQPSVRLARHEVLADRGHEATIERAPRAVLDLDVPVVEGRTFRKQAPGRGVLRAHEDLGIVPRQQARALEQPRKEEESQHQACPHWPWMKPSPSRARVIGSSTKSRQMWMAAANSGSAVPKASIVSHPS